MNSFLFWYLIGCGIAGFIGLFIVYRLWDEKIIITKRMIIGCIINVIVSWYSIIEAIYYFLEGFWKSKQFQNWLDTPIIKKKGRLENELPKN